MLNFVKNKSQSYTAFSLVEMLMALLVASLLLAALAPVMTRHTELVSIDENRLHPNTLRAYVNPGKYAFEVPEGITNLNIQASGGGGGGGGVSSKTYKVPYTSDTSFTVPKGVYEISFSLIGAGGSGGSAYAKTGSDSCGSGSNTIHYMADSGRDLCARRSNPYRTYVWNVVDASKGESCSGPYCCWVNLNYGCSDSPVEGGLSGCGRAVCKYGAASSWCSEVGNYDTGAEGFKTKAGRLLTSSEAKRIVDSGNYGKGSIELPYYDNIDMGLASIYGSKLPIAGISSGVIGTSNNYGYPCSTWLKDAYYINLWNVETPIISSTGTDSGFTVLCVRDLENWFPYTGAGGMSGSKLVQTIKVTPGDTITLVVGKSGATTSAGQKGSNGGDTYLYHKDSTGTVNTYYAKGGTGGNPATSSANGETISSYSPSCSSDGVCSFAIPENDGLGTSGKSESGGYGAGGAIGGTQDTGKGEDGSKHGAGGGGGSCLRTVRTPSSCSAGGRGGSGYIEITYSAVSPGGGGGAGGMVGYSIINNNAKQISLKVSQGEVLNITVGAGGLGGSESSSGFDGKDTVISTKHNEKFIFHGGKGGTSGSFDSENFQIPAEGGFGGNYPDASSKEYKEIIAPLTAKGLSAASDEHGFAGGEGGMTVTGYRGGCGGMQISTDASNPCNSETENGAGAINYDASKNKYGGSGGGGFNPDTGSKGSGGMGADGFVLIKWSE